MVSRETRLVLGSLVLYRFAQYPEGSQNAPTKKIQSDTNPGVPEDRTATGEQADGAGNGVGVHGRGIMIYKNRSKNELIKGIDILIKCPDEKVRV